MPKVEEISIGEVKEEAENRYSNWQAKLVPGKVYKREYLCEVLQN